MNELHCALSNLTSWMQPEYVSKNLVSLKKKDLLIVCVRPNKTKKETLHNCFHGPSNTPHVKQVEPLVSSQSFSCREKSLAPPREISGSAKGNSPLQNDENECSNSTLNVFIRKSLLNKEHRLKYDVCCAFYFLQDEIYGQCLIGTYSFQTVFNVKFIKCICLAFTDSNPEYLHISMHVLHFEKPFLAA